MKFFFFETVIFMFQIFAVQTTDEVSVDEIIADGGLLTICDAHLNVNVTSEVIQSNVSVSWTRQRLVESKKFK